MFSGCTMPPESKKTGLGSSNLEVSNLAGKKSTGTVLAPCHARKCAPATIYGSEDISEAPGCHLLCQMSSQSGSQKLF